MSSENVKLKAAFSSAANSLASFFRTAKELQQESYYYGQRDVLNEMIEFIVNETNGDVKSLNVNTLLEYIEKRTLELRQHVTEFEDKQQNIEREDPDIKKNQSEQMNNLPTPFKPLIEDTNQQNWMNNGQNIQSAMGLGPENMKKQY